MMKKALCLLAAALLFAISAAQAHAQDDQNTEDPQPPKIKLRLSQVTVSATKSERDPLATPGEVSVLTQEYFQQRQAQSLDDVLRYEPNISTGGGPRTMAEVPSIRGLTGARILMLVDGVRINWISGHRGRLFVDMDQLKQVEVIRGPGSALYGSQAIGGVVAMETKDPSDFLAPDMQFGIRQKFGYQDVNREWLSTTTLSARLTDQIEVMTSGTYRAGKNIRLGGGEGRLRNSSQDTLANLSKIVWKPTAYDEAEFSIQATRQDARIPFAADFDSSSESDRENRTVTYRLGYSHDDPANRYLNLRGFVYLTTMNIKQRDVRSAGTDDISFDTVGYDLRNSMNFGKPSTHHHIVTIGSEFYRNIQIGKGNRVSGRTGGLTGAPLYWPRAESNVFALYVQDEITIMDRLTLVPALRWDHWGNEAPGEESRSVGVVNPKIGAVFQVTDFLFLSANYAHGFRQPTFGDLFISGAHGTNSNFFPNPDVNPERSRNLDVGLRVNLPKVLSDDDQFIFKGTYFRNQLKDRITFVQFCEDGSTPIPGFPQQPCANGDPVLNTAQNVQQALIQGWEAEFEWRVSNSLVLNGNYSQLKGTNQTTNESLPGILPKRGVLGINYLYAPWGLTLGGRTQMVADQDPFGGFGGPAPGYTIFDLYATVKPGTVLLPELPKSWLQEWQVNLGVDNLFDRLYRRPLSSINAAGINPKIQVWYSINFP